MTHPKLRIFFFMCLLAFSSLFSGCALFPDAQDETLNWSAQELQSAARSALKRADYDIAIEYYEILEARYPLGRFAQQAQLDLIYAYYQYDEPESAVISANRFIKFYPRHPNIDYAYYMKGIANFDQGYNFFQRYLPLDISQRDQSAAKKSFQSFSTLLSLYPDSRYVKDARQRMVYLRNNLALYEMKVAEYYVKRKAYLAALNRAQYVVKHYDGTTSVNDALALSVKLYKQMQYPQLAQNSLRVLQHNAPDYPQLAELEQLNLALETEILPLSAH
jgi:outer membrane protein assembly factor BamD